MRNSYEVRAQKFIQKIFPYIMGCADLEEVEIAIGNFNMNFNRKVRFAHGMTRFALICSDYVVKVDYSPEGISNFGGCEDEINLYAEAEAEGFDYLLAKITRYDYSGVSFYIMPRIEGICRTWYDADYYMTDEEKNWCDWHGLCDLHCFNYGWKNRHIVLIDYGAHY